MSVVVRFNIMVSIGEAHFRDLAYGMALNENSKHSQNIQY